jgi:hypothetical protein
MTAITPSKTCKKCGNRTDFVATIPTTTTNPRYTIYRCPDCKYIEWLPHGPAPHINGTTLITNIDADQSS